MATLRQTRKQSVAVGRRTFYGDDAVECLTDRLSDLPMVYETRYIDLGIYRGLKFGVTLHPTNHPEIYLQGDAVRHTTIKTGSKGLAVMNALERLTEGYAEAAESTRKELAVAESQLKDYQSRQGAGFAHDAYLKDLTALRDRLRLALSENAPEGETAADIAEKIKTLRAGQAVEAASRSGRAAPSPRRSRSRPG